MTRASLLRILDHVNGISDDEIRELEQLAAAFPYCQTAHVLLAKTAHDRGSMLAGQRLRRAATYAANRELLRQLLERPATAATAAAPATSTVATAPIDTPQTDTIAATKVPAAAPIVSAAETLPNTPAASEVDLFAVEVIAASAPADETVPATVNSAENEPTDNQYSTLITLADEAAPTNHEVPTPSEIPANTQETVVSAPTAADEELPELPEPAAEPPAVQEPAVTDQAAPTELPETEAPVVDEEILAGAAAEPEAVMATAFTITEAAKTTDTRDKVAPEAAVAEEASVPATTAAPEASGELLPAVAPPIRPPGDAGISRFEFGLGEPRLPEPASYQLSDIAEEDEEFDPEEDARPTFRPRELPRITAPFRADAELGYALGGGSRLGYDLQTRTPDGFVLDLPLEAFFEPDALLLAHARAHQTAPKTSSLDLIDRFLKARPRIRAGTAGVPPPADEQADLSVRNSAAAPVLASESLAKIMVRQGKTAKAIEIYERLMARQPEKMAYFAQQIQQLQQPPE